MTTMTLRKLANVLEKSARIINENHVEAIRADDRAGINTAKAKFDAILSVLHAIGAFNPNIKIDIQGGPVTSTHDSTMVVQ